MKIKELITSLPTNNNLFLKTLLNELSLIDLGKDDTVSTDSVTKLIAHIQSNDSTPRMSLGRGIGSYFPTPNIEIRDKSVISEVEKAAVVQYLQTILTDLRDI